MAIREVLRYPHPALKTVADEAALPAAGSEAGRAATAPAPPVDAVADTARAARDLLDTMRSFGHCVGIAAPQLGDLLRIVAVDVSGHPKAGACHGLLLLANPRVVAEAGAEVAREGCLSIPHLTANVRRATRIEIAATALEPTATAVATHPLQIETGGFEARCLLHEIDHLDGILFLDRVDSLTRDTFPRKRYR